MRNREHSSKSRQSNDLSGRSSCIAKWIASALVGLILILPGHLLAQEKTRDVERLLPIMEDEKWGYINLAAETVISPQFEQAWQFSEGRARVSVNELIGFIDATGEIVIEPQYEEAWDFSFGRALVRLDGDHVAVINKQGRIVFRIDYDCQSDSCVGDVRAGVPEPCLQNSTGLHGFYEGLLKVMVGDEIGYVDTNGNFAIEPQFWSAGIFSEGLARAYYPSGRSSGSGSGGLIDRSGRMVIPERELGLVGSFSEGLATAGRPWKQGYIDKTGEFVITPRFAYACAFSDGLAKVVTKKTRLLGEEKKWGYINKRGELVFEALTKNAPFEYDTCHRGWFSEGLAVVRPKRKRKYGYINKDFDYAIPPTFDGAKAFRDGVAYVKRNNVFGYIDKTGKFIWRSDGGPESGRRTDP